MESVLALGHPVQWQQTDQFTMAIKVCLNSRLLTTKEIGSWSHYAVPAIDQFQCE